MAALRKRIQHVIYIVKENRTYDQMLGDLEVRRRRSRAGDNSAAADDAELHALARGSSTWTTSCDSGEVSSDGWHWSTAARSNDFTEREAPVNYGGRGLPYDREGPTGTSTSLRHARASGAQPTRQPGRSESAARRGRRGRARWAGGRGRRGLIWDAALRAGLSACATTASTAIWCRTAAGAARNPAGARSVQAGRWVFHPTKAALMAITDPYFRAFDQAFPDYWRYQEWQREFDGYVARTASCRRSRLVRLHGRPHGRVRDAIDGVEHARDPAGRQRLRGRHAGRAGGAQPYANDTLIFVLEDDAQDGPDHVDAHRSTRTSSGRT